VYVHLSTLLRLKPDCTPDTDNKCDDVVMDLSATRAFASTLLLAAVRLLAASCLSSCLHTHRESMTSFMLHALAAVLYISTSLFKSVSNY
jgi:hypothetical protein